MLEIGYVSDTRVGSAEFGDYHYQEFLNWSFSDRQSKAALLRNMAVARIDANQDSIDRKMDVYADLYGLTVNQLRERIRLADEQNISIVRLHQTLAKEAGLTQGRSVPDVEY